MVRSLLPLIVLLSAGCERVMYDPNQATSSYPAHLHRSGSIDVQAFRKGPTLEIVNSTPVSYRDFDIWVNQRYVEHVDEMGAGQTLRISLWNFWDERGDRFSAGGFWRTEEPTPLSKVQLQVNDEDPLIGLVTIAE